MTELIAALRAQLERWGEFLHDPDAPFWAVPPQSIMRSCIADIAALMDVCDTGQPLDQRKADDTSDTSDTSDFFIAS